MAKVNFKHIFKAVERTAKEHSPEILTGIGIAGFIATVVLAVKATPEVAESLEFARENIAYDEYTSDWLEDHQDPIYDGMQHASFDEFLDCEYAEGLYPVKLKFKEIFQMSWRSYLPAAITGCTSIACVIGGVSTSLRRTAAMATVAKVAETTLKEYSKKVVEEVGEEKEKEIKKEAKKAAVEKLEAENIPKHYDNETRLYCDGYLKKAFYATPVEIERAIGELNRMKDLYTYFSLNEFYSCLKSDSCPAGDELGWDDADGVITYHIADTAITYDGRPALVVDFSADPHLL